MSNSAKVKSRYQQEFWGLSRINAKCISHILKGWQIVNHNLINAAAFCIVISTVYLGAKEAWLFVEYRQAQAQLQGEKLKAAMRDVLGDIK